MFPKLLLLLIVGLAVLTHTSAQRSCPPADQVAPCECDEGRLGFFCDGYVHPDLNLKEIFDRVSPLIGEDVIFNDLKVHDLPTLAIPADTMTSLKFKSITLEYNKFEFIHRDAFNATYDVTTYLNIADNELTNANNSQDNFDFLRRFTKLETLIINHNALETIPDEPFGDLPNLHTLEVGQCYSRLSQVGSRILANLPSLKNVQFRYCDISQDELALDTFEGIAPDAVLDLQHNPITSMPEAIFRPVLETAAGLLVGGEECPVVGPCSTLRLECDQDAAWLCRNQSIYEPKLEGFVCRAGFNGYNIWNWCRDNGAH